MTPEQMQNALYPSSAPAEGPQPTRPAQAPQAEPRPLHEHLLGSSPAKEPLAAVPEAVAQLRDTSARRMYGATAFAAELRDDAVAGLDAREARAVAQDLGAEHTDVTRFVKLANEAAPSMEQVQAWRAETQAMLKAHSITGADLDLARRFVARDGRVRQALDRNSLGDRPDVVARVVALARSARGRGEI